MGDPVCAECVFTFMCISEREKKREVDSDGKAYSFDFNLLVRGHTTYLFPEFQSSPALHVGKKYKLSTNDIFIKALPDSPRKLKQTERPVEDFSLTEKKHFYYMPVFLSKRKVPRIRMVEGIFQTHSLNKVIKTERLTMCPF